MHDIPSWQLSALRGHDGGSRGEQGLAGPMSTLGQDESVVVQVSTEHRKDSGPSVAVTAAERSPSPPAHPRTAWQGLSWAEGLLRPAG
jgi:hypothetical protein